jgi:glutamate/aspartate transport system permease protein
MNYHWHWGILLEAPYTAWLLEGFLVTVMLSLVGWAIALPFGALVGVLRTVSNPLLRAGAAFYVQLFRNVPLLAQMFLWFFVLPEIVPPGIGRFLKRDMPFPEFVTAAACLGLYTASRVAETVRAGIDSVGPGPRNAALASGMNAIQTYRHVLLPIAFRLIVPPLTSEFLGIFKNSSVALTVGVLELTMQAHQVENDTFQGFEAFTAATVLYAAISWSCLRATRALGKKSEVVGMIGQEALAR